MVFLYILVFAFYMFKTVKVSVTAERNWGDVNLFKPCWFLAYVKKNVFSLQAFRRHDQDNWCRIFFDTILRNCDVDRYRIHITDFLLIIARRDVELCWEQHIMQLFMLQCVTVALCASSACVTFFLHETSLLLVSLFYGKCYVTMFIRELSRSPIAIWENFF